MANSARIDELEKKFSENARRYFAPLANEYRKAGDLARAIEICRAHLPQQPGHMSGHVVYGQALYESRQLEEAKSVFEAALGLDPENLIALRHLGDIARDSGDPDTARTWYTRVLDADPRNDEVAGMLAELDALPATPAAPAEQPPAADGVVSWGDINPEAAKTAESSSATTPASNAAATEPPSESAGDDTSAEETEVEAEAGATEPNDAPPARAAAPSPDAELFAPSAPKPDAGSIDRVLNDAFAEADTLEMDVPETVRSASKAAQNKAPEAPPADVDDETFAEVDALFDEISPPRAPTGSQSAVPSATSKPDESPAGKDAAGDKASSGDAFFGDDPSAGDTDTAPLPGLETSEFVSPSRQPSAPRRDTGSMAVTGLTSFDQPTDEDSSTRAAFVTETMAELYLQQGFTAEALDIYRQLLAKDPDDESLRDRVAQLERGGRTSLSVAAVSSEIIEAAQQRHATRQVRTVRSFFGLLAGRRAPHRAADDGSTNGDERATGLPQDAPVQAYAEESGALAEPLDIVGGLFGAGTVSEEDERAASTLASAFSSGAMPDRPPSSSPQAMSQASGPTGRAAHSGGSELSLDQVFRDTASRNPRKSGAYSFDQFFSDGTPTAAGAGQPGNAPADDAAESPEGDLEQFTAWLEGLKRK